MQRRDDADDGAIAREARPDADHPFAQLPRGIVVDTAAAPDRLSTQRALLQLRKLRAARQIEIVMALTRERDHRQTECVNPGGIGCDIAQLAVEHRDAGRDVVDELGYPLRRRRVALGVGGG